MSRKRSELTQAELDELGAAYDGCREGATRTRYQAVRLYGSGYSEKEILKIVRCSRSSLMDWWRSYRQDGLPGLADKRVGGNRALLTPAQVTDLKERLHQYTPAQVLGPDHAGPGEGSYWSIPDLQMVVKRWYQVEYRSQTSYRTLLHQCGFSYQRSEKVYRSRAEAAVVAFEEELEKNSSTWLKRHRRR